MQKLTRIPLWTKWKRPQSVPFPNTWHRFKMESKYGKIFKVKIVDLTPDRFDDALEFMVNYFYSSEPIAVCSKLLEDKISLHNDLCEQKTISQQHASLLAVMDEDIPKPEIVGLHKLLVISKNDDPATKLSGRVIQKITKFENDLEKNHNPFEILAADKLIRDFGICVKSEYRCQDIGYHLAESIEKFSRTFGIGGMVVMCSSAYSQTIAEKLQFKLVNEIVYNEYKDDQGQVIFPVKKPKSFKLFMKKYI